MILSTLFGRLVAKLQCHHGAVKSFEHEIEAGGGMAGRCDAGLHAVEVGKIIGSVGRAGTLRGDFSYKYGRTRTERFRRIGRAMQEGKVLPPLELYKVLSDYYVLDGHHRVAMALKLGQDFLDAHVVEYRLASTR